MPRNTLAYKICFRADKYTNDALDNLSNQMGVDKSKIIRDLVHEAMERKEKMGLYQKIDGVERRVKLTQKGIEELLKLLMDSDAKNPQP